MSLDLSLSLYRTQKTASAPAAFTPDDLSNKYAWYDFTDAASITTSGSDITAISDQYGLNSPTILNTPTYNGSNTATFDDTSLEGLQLSVPSSGLTVYLVLTAPASANTEVLLIDASQAAGDPLWAAASGSSSDVARELGSPSFRFNGAAASWTTRDDLYTDVFTGSKCIVAMIGASVASFTSDLVLFRHTTSTVGYNGSCHEIIILDGTPSASEISDLESYLSAKHSVTI